MWPVRSAAYERELRAAKEIAIKDAAALRSALIANAPSPMTYATPKPEEVVREDEEIQVFPVRVDPSRIRIVNVEDLFVK